MMEQDAEKIRLSEGFWSVLPWGDLAELISPYVREPTLFLDQLSGDTYPRRCSAVVEKSRDSWLRWISVNWWKKLVGGYLIMEDHRIAVGVSYVLYCVGDVCLLCELDVVSPTYS